MACKYFKGNYVLALEYVFDTGLVKEKISLSRFSRRLNRLTDFILYIKDVLGSIGVSNNKENNFMIDSCPVSVCHNIRIRRCKLLQGEEYRGYTSSKKEYFYGFRLQILINEKGNICEFALQQGRENDQPAFNCLNFDIPEGSNVYADKGYINYLQELILKECGGINFLPIRKSNSKTDDNTLFHNWIRQKKRKYVETTISEIDKLLPQKIHATNINAFILKLTGFILAYNFHSLFLT